VREPSICCDDKQPSGGALLSRQGEVDENAQMWLRGRNQVSKIDQMGKTKCPELTVWIEKVSRIDRISGRGKRAEAGRR
jgi:hypothetical protein